MTPNGWVKTDLEKVTLLITKGATPTTYGYDYVSSSYKGAVKFYRVNNASFNGRFLSNGIKHITGEAHNFLQRSQLISGDCIIAIVGNTVGVNFCVTDSLLPANISQNVALIRPNPKTLRSEYLAQYLQSGLIQKHIKAQATIQAQPSLSLKQVGEFPILLPPIHEQKRIAEILETWDEAIALTERAIEARKRRKKVLVNNLLSGKTRLLPSEGDWKEINQGSVVTFYNGRAYKLSEWESQGTPVIRLQNLTGRGENYYYSTLQLPEHQYVDSGDLLYMWSATFGPHIWKGDRAIYHYHIWKVVCSERIEKMYLYYILDYLTQSWMSSTNGMGLLHLTKATMEKQKISLPSLREQRAIAEILELVDHEITIIQNKLSLLKLQKQGLMQKLLTGEWRVAVQEAA